MPDFDISAIPNQANRIAIVTGANIGLGYETTLALAKKKIRVIMACRNQEKAKAAQEKILKEVPDAELELIPLDLSSLESVRAFTDQFHKQHERLDLLINNAGIMIPPRGETKDGFESQFGVNHLGHFLLSGLLLPTLNKTPDSRLVALSSLAHQNGKINFDDLQSEKSYSRIGAYNQSKLANLMFAYELQRRLTASGQGTLAVAAHPGLASTNLGQYVPWYLTPLIPVFSLFFAQSAAQGSEPTLMAALSPDVKGGDYFGPNNKREFKGHATKVSSTPLSHDREVARKLWEVSEKLVGFEFKV